MPNQRVLIVSGQPVISEGLKLLIESMSSAEVATAADESDAVTLIAELAPSVIVVDRELIAEDPGQMDRDDQEDYPDKVVVINPNNDRMVIYSRQRTHFATLENLLDTIRTKDV